MEEILNSLIEGYRGNMLCAAGRLIEYDSVLEAEGGQGAPFGTRIARAQQEVLKLGRELGFETKDYDGYVAAIDFGSQGRQIGILSHIDVVPAGEGWSYPPFKGTVENGRLYGRGSVDDKGPMVAALYAMKAIAESGLPIKNHVRHIIGCDEESGFSRCMKYYLTKEKQPWGGFSPDGEFPVIHAEKGIMRFTIGAKWPQAGEGLRIVKLHGGTKVNVVPSGALAVLEGDPEAFTLVKNKMAVYEKKEKLLIETGDRTLTITATGQGAHSSQPWNGENAIALLLEFLKTLPIRPKAEFNYISAVSRLFGDGYRGENLSIRCEDGLSGMLTLSLGVLDMDTTSGKATIDMRYPIHADKEMLWKTITMACEEEKLDIEILQDKPNIYIPKTAPLVQTLLKVYQEISGRDEGPVVIGGGTYCRTMNNFVAYGPVFPGQKELAHEADESIAVDDLVMTAKIYARALYVLLQQ
ncbi:MAG TPA: dipeptidase PepV [Clostridia bacterium]|nr:dipeptidase PepV [Clostridia bacterium]